MSEIDFDAGYAMYLERFTTKFGEQPEGAFVKFGKHMVQKLGAKDFPERLTRYVKMHKACKEMLDSGATISDALVLDFDEAAAWVAVAAPNLLAMFRGEMGDPKDHAPERAS